MVENQILIQLNYIILHGEYIGLFGVRELQSTDYLSLLRGHIKLSLNDFEMWIFSHD